MKKKKKPFWIWPKYLISLLASLILFLIALVIGNFPDILIFGLKLRIWEYEIMELIRLLIIIYGIPKTCVLLKRKGEFMKKMFTVIKRNKVTIVGYLCIIITNISVLLLTNLWIKNPEIVETWMVPLGLIQNGVVNQTAVYSIVGSILAVLSGVSIYATTKPGWENKIKYEKRINENQQKRIIDDFILQVKERVDEYKNKFTADINYLFLFPTPIYLSMDEKRYIDDNRSKIVESDDDDKMFQSILNLELLRLMSTEAS